MKHQLDIKNGEIIPSQVEIMLDRVAVRVIQEIYREFWDSNGYDKRLYRAMLNVIEHSKATSLAIFECDQSICFSCLGIFNWKNPKKATVLANKSLENGMQDRKSLEKSIAKYTKNVIEKLATPVKLNEPIFQMGDGEHCDFMILFPAGNQIHHQGKLTTPSEYNSSVSEFANTRNNVGEYHLKPSTFSCLYFHWSGLSKLLGADSQVLKSSKFIKDVMLKCIGRNILPLVLDSFRYFEQHFAAFPGPIRERYWQDINFQKKESNSSHLIHSPPWDICETTKHTVKTATLSLDLRKSTYCMEYSESNRKFGRWLEMFTEKMRSVAHRHGGIYDKFTGDGSLVHFLERECREIYNKSAVDAAVECAVDMQRVIELHMRDLRMFLQHDSPQFGAGIAIDVNEAHWAYEKEGYNPVVVGRGVVGACRVGDKAPRKTIRLTNLAFHQLSDDIRNSLTGIKQVDLEAKDVPAGLTLQCWQFDANLSDALGHGNKEMAKLCKEVKDRFL